MTDSQKLAEKLKAGSGHENHIAITAFSTPYRGLSLAFWLPQELTELLERIDHPGLAEKRRDRKDQHAKIHP